jgi:hypothetical protein
MTTLHMRAFGALLTALVLDGCASVTARSNARPSQAEVRSAIEVDNQSRDRIDVYVITQEREWHLGRLAPGAKARLAMRDRAETGAIGMIQLAIIASASRSLRPSRDARAIVSLKQPTTEVLGQRWVFAEGRLTGLPPRGGPVPR